MSNLPCRNHVRQVLHSSLDAGHWQRYGLCSGTLRPTVIAPVPCPIILRKVVAVLVGVRRSCSYRRAIVASSAITRTGGAIGVFRTSVTAASPPRHLAPQPQGFDF